MGGLDILSPEDRLSSAEHAPDAAAPRVRGVGQVTCPSLTSSSMRGDRPSHHCPPLQGFSAAPTASRMWKLPKKFPALLKLEDDWLFQDY